MNESNKAVVATPNCVDCREQFEITAGEKEFYEMKGLSLPKRCKKCRAAKKARNENRGGGRSHNERPGYGY